MSPKEIAEALCREAATCSNCSLKRVCDIVDPDLMPNEMNDENVCYMLSKLGSKKVKQQLQPLK